MPGPPSPVPGGAASAVAGRCAGAAGSSSRRSSMSPHAETAAASRALSRRGETNGRDASTTARGDIEETRNPTPGASRVRRAPRNWRTSWRSRAELAAWTPSLPTPRKPGSDCFDLMADRSSLSAASLPVRVDETNLNGVSGSVRCEWFGTEVGTSELVNTHCRTSVSPSARWASEVRRDSEA